MPFQQKPTTLRPLPTRVTPRQYGRLMQHRERDHLSIQEHVRRALDLYLVDLDKKWERELMLDGSLAKKDTSLPPPPSGVVKSKSQKTSPSLPQKANLQSGPPARDSKLSQAGNPKLVYR